MTASSDRKLCVTADAIQKMLAAKHSGDVFVPECKDGPTQTRAHLRLDAWVLLKTWSPITTIGYEIKVDRGDWRRDDKLHQYMPLCHLLYVVAPKGIVPAEELPSGVGLIEPVGEAGRLQTRRKAGRREVALPAELMVYVLMCRTQITRERLSYATDGDRHWRTEQLRQWTEGKEERHSLSYAVSAKIRAVFDKQQSELADERRRNDELESVRNRIAELGFDTTKHVDTWAVRRRLEKLNRTIDGTTLWQMRQTGKRLAELADELERLRNGAADNNEPEVA